MSTTVSRLGRLLGAAAVVATISVAGSSGAAGQAAGPTIPSVAPLVTTPPTALPSADPSPRIRVLLAQLAVISARGAVADARAAVTDQQQLAARAYGDQTQAQLALDGATQLEAAAEGELRAARDQLGSTAVFAYMRPPGGDAASAMVGDANVGEQERELLAVSLEHHQQEVVDAQAAIEDAGADVDAATRALAAAQQSAADQDRQVAAAWAALGDARSGLRDAGDELNTATADAWRPTPWSSWQLAIEGPSAFTADELARWYEAQGHGSRASVPIADLARSFIDQGEAEGIRGDMAFAQSIHETGWFANDDTVTLNNFAGIGHCSACAAGYPFVTADIGVLAQIQLLKSYAEVDPVYNRPRADPTLDGPSGCCPTWTELGGVWATDPGYGPRILGYYADMLEWLVADRTTRT
jgi:hypothetical protein